MLASMPSQDSIVKAATHFLGSSGRRIQPTARSSWMFGVWIGLGTFVAMTLTLLQADYCRKTNWGAPGQFVHVCYSDIPTTTLGAKLVDSAFPWLPSFAGSDGVGAMQQAPGSSALFWLAAQIAKPADTALASVYDLAALLIAAALAVMGMCVVKMRNGSLADGSLVVLSPVIIAAGMISFDLVGVALAVAGVAAVFAGRQVLAGILWICAALITIPMIVVPIAALLVSFNAARRLAYVVASAVAMSGFMFFHGVWAVTAPGPFNASWNNWLHPRIGYGSLHKAWSGWAAAHGSPIELPDSTQMGTIAWLVVFASWVSVGIWAATAKKPPHLPLVVLLMILPVIVIWPTVPVQASLWLLPWAALSVRRWNIMLLWAVAEIAFTVVTWQHLYAGSTMPKDSKVRKAAYGANAELYAVATTLRVFAACALAWIAFKWRHDADFNADITDCWPDADQVSAAEVSADTKSVTK